MSSHVITAQTIRAILYERTFRRILHSELGTPPLRGGGRHDGARSPQVRCLKAFGKSVIDRLQQSDGLGSTLPADPQTRENS